MTGREHISKRVRRGGIGYLPFPLAIVALAVLAYSTQVEGLLFFLVGLALLFVAIMIGMVVSIFVTCPVCDRWIGQILRFGATPFVSGLPRQTRFCPFCGSDFDAELEEQDSEEPPVEPEE